ncbi:hypothetical protein ACHQM5_001370 [Ranunculus cassubicifolius]
MSSSSDDDEGEIIVKAVDNYLFVDENDEPVSFSVLPIQWSEAEMLDSIEKTVFLDGFTDDGNQKIYIQVMRWKFQMLDKFPRVLVLGKDNRWIRLLQPRKSFVHVTRTILVTLHVLHYVNKSPEASGEFVWDQLSKVFSFYEARPSGKDLTDHFPLIKEAMKQDDTLSKSQFLAAILENTAKREGQEEDVHPESEVNNSNFIVDDNDDLDVGDYASDEEEADLFDTVCAFCDNGGELLCCEGRCIRSFHATKYDGTESHCTSLGFSITQLKAMPSFLCPNCEHKMHQCYICRKLGSSDRSIGAEVFQCITATCGYFYHPECVAKVLHPTDEAEANLEMERISAGESFTCPAHKCCVCKHGENKDIPELQFAVCRRCPKSYHRKCLPSKIVFDATDEDEEDDDVLTRAWPNMLPYNRVLIYCLRHKIDRILKTPARDHIIFPPSEDKNRKLEQLVAKKRAAVERRTLSIDDCVSERSVKVPKYDVKHDIKHSLNQKFYSEKSKAADASRKISRENVEKTSAIDKRREVEEMFNWSQSLKCKDKKVISKPYDEISKCAPAPKEHKYQLDFEAKNRIITMMKKTESLVTVEDIKNGHKIPSTCANSLKTIVDKTITLGKVEGFVEAVRTALQKLDAGGSIEDAKAVCGPDVVNQIIGWKKKLTVYLAPFLHGNRYTSFGRHFTKLNKLQEIVDKLHWYTKNGDTIVDFCCGANDFSWLMKDKLEETKKSCHFRNFDIIHPKNDFCFEKRDWMTVKKSELPVGDNLIMGLNPPFGYKASLANQFIEKALEFKPKLVILIVPPETQRLDRKGRYDLIWEDKESLAGKAFYLPGSVDVNNNQIEQWNNVAPPLSLWSRSDWTKRHKKIALNQGHVSKEQRHSENYSEGQKSDQFQSGPSATSVVEAASEASEWTYPCRRETATQPPQHYKRKSKFRGKKRGGGPSFSSSSNQAPVQHTGFGGDPSFSSTSNDATAQHTGFGGGPSFSYKSNQVPAQHTDFGGGPSFSYASNQVPAQHTDFGGAPSFSYASNQVPSYDAGFGSLDPLPSAPYQRPSYDSSYGFGYQAGLFNSSDSQYVPDSSFPSFYPSMSEFAPAPPNPPFQ